MDWFFLPTNHSSLSVEPINGVFYFEVIQVDGNQERGKLEKSVYHGYITLDRTLCLLWEANWKF